MHSGRIITAATFIVLAFSSAVQITTRASTNTPIQLVSVAMAASEVSQAANGISAAAAMTSDARFVAFVSDAANLTTNIVSGGSALRFVNVFLRDRASLATTLVSVTPDNSSGGNGSSSKPSLSDDGRFVAFESDAGNLVASDANGVSDIFLRDLQTGVTRAVSARADQQQTGNGPSANPSLTPDGRFVLFESSASDLVPGDTNGLADVFLTDVTNRTTRLVSVGAIGPAGAASGVASMSTNAERVAFVSTASNIVAGAAAAGAAIYVRDLAAGTTVWASRDVPAAVGETNAGDCINPQISAEGQDVVFQCLLRQSGTAAVFRFAIDSGVTDLITTNCPATGDWLSETAPAAISDDGRYVVYEESASDGSVLYQWDGQTRSRTLVTAAIDAPLTPASGSSTMPQLTASGRWVTFLSSSPNLVTNAVIGDFEGFMHDMDTGMTRLITAGKSGAASAGALFETPLLSEDGQITVFSSLAADFGVSDPNQAYDVYDRDLGTGTTGLISVAAHVAASNTPNGFSSLGIMPMSETGRFILFESKASNLTSNDTNDTQDLFLRDLNQSRAVLVSSNTNGWSANGASHDGLLSANGSVVAFESTATDLARGDTNSRDDLYVRDIAGQTIVLASQDVDGNAAGIDSNQPIFLSSDGRIVCFASPAPRLVPDDLDTVEDLFWRDLPAGMTVRVNTVRFGHFLGASADGRTVAYADLLGTSLIVWDAQTRQDKLRVTLGPPPIVGGQLSPQGDTLYYFATAQGNTILRALDLSSRDDTLVGRIKPGVQAGLVLSADGRWAAYVSDSNPVGPNDTNQTSDIVLWDRWTKTSTVVSANRDGSALNGTSDNPSISGDGRWVAFRFLAAGIPSSGPVIQSDLFVYDHESGTISLISTNHSGTAAQGRSSNPRLSLDGSTLAFQSAALDLVVNDQNGAVDIFAAKLIQQAGVKIQSIERATTGQVTLQWEAVAGRTYQVEFRDSLAAGAWDRGSGDINISGTQASYTDATATGPARFYRVNSSAAQ